MFSVPENFFHEDIFPFNLLVGSVLQFLYPHYPKETVIRARVRTEIDGNSSSRYVCYDTGDSFLVHDYLSNISYVEAAVKCGSDGHLPVTKTCGILYSL
jgi:hypothetical protein